MIKAIIFDCFGVLVSSSLHVFYKTHFGDNQDKIQRADELMELSNHGSVSHEDFVEFLAKEAGITYEEADRQLNQTPRNEELLAYIRTELSQSYKLAILTNASDNWLNELFTPADLELFDATVVSCETGYAKPEAQIYEIAAQKLGVRLDECVFIDDRQNYLEGAQAVGMQTVLFADFEQFKSDLKEILK